MPNRRANAGGLRLKNRKGGAWDPARLSQVQLASLCGVSGPAVTGWGKRGCPRNADGSYSLQLVIKWIRGGSVDLGRLPQTEILKLLDVSKPSLGEWETRGCPRNADGTYNAVAVVRWRLAELEKRIDDARKLSKLDEVKVRHGAVNAELAEIELREKRGEILPRAAVVSGLAARYQTLKASLVGLVGRMSQEGLAAEHIAKLRGEIDQMLHRLASGLMPLQLDPTIAQRIEQILMGMADPPPPPPPPPAAAEAFDSSREDFYG